MVMGLLLPGVASAKTKAPKGVTGTCSGFSGNVNATITISGCNPEAAGSDGGTFSFSSTATAGDSSIAWSDGAVTTFSFKGKEELPMNSAGTKPNKKFKCASGDTVEFLLKGKVEKNPAGNTGLPSGDVGFGGSVKADVCVDGSSNVSLRTGVFTL